MKSLLLTKSWKIFFFMTGLPILMVLAAFLLAGMAHHPFFIAVMPLLAAFTILVIYYLWLWIAGTTITKITTDNNTSTTQTFKILISVSLLVIFILLPLLKATELRENKILMQLIWSIAVSCFIFALYLISKNLRQIEKKYFDNDSYILMDIVLLWLLPIGIWFLQPRIQKIIYHYEQNRRSLV